MAEQLVEVPLVSPSSCVLNALVPQMGVEVPNVVSQPEFQQHSVEQNVDIPVPGARGLLDGGGLQGFPSGQRSTARWLDGGGLHGFPADIETHAGADADTGIGSDSDSDPFTNVPFRSCAKLGERQSVDCGRYGSVV